MSLATVRKLVVVFVLNYIPHAAASDGSLGSRLGNSYSQLIDFRGEAYAAGKFGLAVLKANSWQLVGGKYLVGRVRSMEVFRNELWIGGDFYVETATGVAWNLVIWDGTSFKLPTAEFNGEVRKIYNFNNRSLLIGGSFMRTANLEFGNLIVQWDGSRFSPVVNLLPNFNPNPYLVNTINDITSIGEALYFSGVFVFEPGNGPPIHSIAIVENRVVKPLHWDADPNDFEGRINDLEVRGSELLVAGVNFGLPDPAAQCVARYDNKQWLPVGIEGIYCSFLGAEQLASIGENVFVLGSDLRADHRGEWEGERIMVLKDEKWRSPLSKGMGLAVSPNMLPRGDSVYLSGANFYRPDIPGVLGDVRVDKDLKIHASEFPSALGKAIYSSVGPDGKLYIGGQFAPHGENKWGPLLVADLKSNTYDFVPVPPSFPTNLNRIDEGVSVSDGFVFKLMSVDANGIASRLYYHYNVSTKVWRKLATPKPSSNIGSLYYVGGKVFGYLSGNGSNWKLVVLENDAWVDVLESDYFRRLYCGNRLFYQDQTSGMLFELDGLQFKDLKVQVPGEVESLACGKDTEQNMFATSMDNSSGKRKIFRISDGTVELVGTSELKFESTILFENEFYVVAHPSRENLRWFYQLDSASKLLKPVRAALSFSEFSYPILLEFDGGLISVGEFSAFESRDSVFITKVVR
jgi:hypothetical protein